MPSTWAASCQQVLFHLHTVQHLRLRLQLMATPGSTARGTDTLHQTHLKAQRLLRLRLQLIATRESTARGTDTLHHTHLKAQRHLHLRRRLVAALQHHCSS